MNIWPFKKKTQTLEGGFTDWHCHILPGVDDGVQTMEESLAILSLYEKMGIDTVWLTPHIMEDIPNTTERLRARFAELQIAYRGNISLHLAAENMLDNLFEKRLLANDLLPIGAEGNALLVETSYYTPPMNLYGLIEQIKAKGYYPILAHPERYVYMDKADYQKLHQMGVKFQLNFPSLEGLYGKTVQGKAKELLSKGYYHFYGTDIHRIGLLKRLSQSNIQKAVMQIDRR